MFQLHVFFEQIFDVESFRAETTLEIAGVRGFGIGEKIAKNATKGGQIELIEWAAQIGSRGRHQR